MTVSQNEREAGLLRSLSEGYGEVVGLTDLVDRDVDILKDLQAIGYSVGKTYKGGMARFQITSAGETCPGDRERALLSYEKQSVASGEQKDRASNKAIAFVGHAFELSGWLLLVGLLLMALTLYLFR